jgi:hypothetical protein
MSFYHFIVLFPSLSFYALFHQHFFCFRIRGRGSKEEEEKKHKPQAVYRLGAVATLQDRKENEIVEGNES